MPEEACALSIQSLNFWPAMVKIVIDGKSYDVEEGRNLLETVLSLGLDLPYFCWHPAMGSVGSCRQCAVKKFKDEDDEQGKITMACMEPVKDGLRTSIENPEARRFRSHIIESLMTNHPHDCPTCDEGGECHLQDMTVMSGHNYRRYRFNKRTYRNQYLGPFLNHEMNRCIQCYRCVRFYKEYAGGKDLDVFAAHNHVYFGRHEDGILENEFSGNLVEVCPTGVFTDKTLKKHYTRKWDLSNGPSICQQCSLGCNIITGERYGSLRRVRSRYNADVNGYFLCDRGRFGYEFVNSDDRLRLPFAKRNGAFEPLNPEEATEMAAALISPEKKVVAIGSPRASLEANFALKQLAGADNFYDGMSRTDRIIARKAMEILTSFSVKTPSLKEIEKADAILVLGEDLTNSAPMMALAIRQAARHKQFSIAGRLDIPSWNDHAVREAAQDTRSPIYIAMPYSTPLDDIAAQTHRAAPAGLARLGFAVAKKINSAAPAPEKLPKGTDALAGEVADALASANHPLVIAGASLQSPALLEAAANICLALQQKDKSPLLSFVLPEANTAGLALLGGKPLEEAFNAEADTVVLLENDLFRRAEEKKVQQFLDKPHQILILDHIHTSTADSASLVLPSGAFAESDGTLVNQEGRAQRYYQAYVPESPIRESWRWLHEIAGIAGSEELNGLANLDDITRGLAKAEAVFRGIDELAPPPGFRINGQRIARQSHRYSGRTAMHANQTMDEPPPPPDPDSPLAFSMEGYHGKPPSSLIPFYWSPGWNSVQSINKYQIEVGGHLHGGDPGKRLIEPGNEEGQYFEEIPEEWEKRPDTWLLAPICHIFGQEETSALAPAIRERMPAPYLALNPEDASKAQLEEGEIAWLELPGGALELPVRLLPSLPAGLAGMPRGLPGIPFWEGLPDIRTSQQS
ncbi:MAG: NADH-quinone oxidoreductase subunit NuoG [Phaeodactylibacter sp.]|nr:NADH-quinone oxidoreductase subunit NuoG [Phaeodactylibacter sp.]